MPPSVLIALERRGLGEAAKNPGDKLDMNKHQARHPGRPELIKRKAGAGVVRRAAGCNALPRQLQERVDDKVSAATTLLDYAGLLHRGSDQGQPGICARRLARLWH